MVGYADLRENSTNILERDKISKDSRNMKRCIIEVNPGELGW